MGFGKSKLIRHLIKYYTDPTVYEEKRILVFPLKYSDLFVDDLFEVEKLLEFCSSCSDEIEDHKKCVFMIDGFDEKDETLQEKNKNLLKIIDFTKTNDRFTIFIASRRFKEYTSTDKDNNKLKRYTLEGLTLNKILKFLEELCKELNIKNRIIEDIKKSSLFKELPNSPIAAILLARLFESNSKDLPANLPELYSMYIELVLGKWDIDKGIESIKEYQVVQAILIRISYYFIDNQCDYITFNDYKEIVQNYISSRNLEFTFDRMDFLMTKRAGVLVKDTKAEIINYSHRSFIEFMYAKGKSINNDLVVTEKAFNLTWQNIYYFYIGIKKDCKEILIDIMSLEPNNEAEQWFRLINLSNYFLAAHATPYIFFKENLYKIFIEAATLYVEKTLSKKDSIFSKLPQLIALWWVQLLIKENYAYDFFKNALEDTTLLIDDLEIDEDVKLYALFFLGTVGLRLEIFEPFKYLLSKYKEKLPSDITIGIMNEIEIENVNDDTILKSKKWLDRRASRMHKMLIRQLTEEPIYKQK